ncbi:MAG: DUF512 domain-containing protein [Clostridia bacterium]|nr:DUF512 domain-containing protein [Clostridia bacterium]
MKHITEIAPESPAFRAGLRVGDELKRIGGEDILDALDYRFFAAEAGVEVTVLREGEELTFRLDNEPYEDLGLSFQTYLMDKHRSCRNKCIFCFIDQLPEGMRESLYFKDDDERLSLLFGNYVTLTNLSDREFQRIIDLHLSPINVSVHATDPEVRKKLLCNRFAGPVLDQLRRFTEAGLSVNCQLVICPGYNDGAVLEKSLADLVGLGENIHSIAVIPLGMTDHREGLVPLQPVGAADAEKMIALCNRFGDACLKTRGLRTVYAADELYIKAGRPLPPAEYYEDFPQLDNGVGMIRRTELEFREALSRMRFPLFARKRRASLVTGLAAAGFMRGLVDEFQKKCHNRIEIEVIPVRNDFFGHGVDVSGLLTGGDIAAQLGGRELGEFVILPGNAMKRDEDIFLDDMTLPELSRRLGVPVCTSGTDGGDLAEALRGGRLAK